MPTRQMRVQNVLTTIHDLRKGTEQVITIIGCGGDRDRTKRPVMAAMACEWSDKVILTSDNPRSEDPAELLLKKWKLG
jgi:UDP-N-acetylmuramoyl-L-alanyl-D-glutamate--2,6-diaminopimelate ligase